MRICVAINIHISLAYSLYSSNFLFDPVFFIRYTFFPFSGRRYAVAAKSIIQAKPENSAFLFLA